MAGHNQIEIVKSPYSTNIYFWNWKTSISFTYSIVSKPTEPGYNEESAEFSLLLTLGMSLVQLLSFFVENGGTNFNSSWNHFSHKCKWRSALVTPESKNIGIIQNTQFTDIGYDYPSDETMRLVSNVPEAV